MLNNFVLPASVSSGHAVEGVQPIQGFAPYNQLAQLMPTFSLADDGAKPEDEEKKKTGDARESENEPTEDSSIQQLLSNAFNVSFKEMLDFFLVPDQEKIRELQFRFRNEREVDDLTIFAPAGSVPKEFEALRDKLYEVQMQLFKTPKGIHCHFII